MGRPAFEWTPGKRFAPVAGHSSMHPVRQDGPVTGP